MICMMKMKKVQYNVQAVQYIFTVGGESVTGEKTNAIQLEISIRGVGDLEENLERLLQIVEKSKEKHPNTIISLRVQND